MARFNVKWRVEETVVGPGEHDDGVREGDVRVLGRGEVIKEGISAEALRDELTGLLRQQWPEHALGGTFDLERSYRIDIEPVPVSPLRAERDRPPKPGPFASILVDVLAKFPAGRAYLDRKEQGRVEASRNRSYRALELERGDGTQ